MLRVGITGGIGSGKSTVAGIFNVLGIPVYYADESAKKLMQEDPVRKEIIDLFGDQTYPQGILDRKYLAAQVFDNAENLKKLNAIVHPATIRAAEEWFLQQNSSYVLKEAAIMFESGSNSGVDKVIGVFAPEAMRIKRVMERDNVTEQKVRDRMANQMNEEKKMALCDFVILNDETRLLIPQVMAVHSSLLALSAQKTSHG
ncbi:dephospho-CoA kinase [Pollutibacter soli]|uniref:dephospho-CoA kinase n=1 Tax=Pollutibacter soli TaxID=3034157 RepID=UPI0030138182